MSITPVEIKETKWFPQKDRGKKIWRRAYRNRPGHYWEIVRVSRQNFRIAAYRHGEPREMVSTGWAGFDCIKNAAGLAEEE